MSEVGKTLPHSAHDDEVGSVEFTGADMDEGREGSFPSGVEE